MKPFTQTRKIIAVLMSFILMTELTGCYSTKIISTSEINQKDYYQIHYKNRVWNAYNVTVIDSIMSGKLDFNLINPRVKGSNNIYVSNDTLLKINNDIFSLPVNGISGMEQKVPDPRKTRILTITLVASAAAITVFTILIVSAVNSMNRTVNEINNSCDQSLSNLNSSDPQSCAE